MNNILIDSCFWYALFDGSDEHHSKASKMIEYLEFGNIVLPFPILYETLNTRFCKRENWVNLFNEYKNRANTVLVPDTDYREEALSNTLVYSLQKNRPISLVDMSIRLMLEDINLNINTLITFNIYDFIDVCATRGIELISE